MITMQPHGHQLRMLQPAGNENYPQSLSQDLTMALLPVMVLRVISMPAVENAMPPSLLEHKRTH